MGLESASTLAKPANNNHTPKRADVTYSAILPLRPFSLKGNRMQSYQDYQTKQNEFETEANEKHETTGAILHWLFLLISAAISAGVALDQLELEATAPLPLFVDERLVGMKRLMQALDFCNARLGGNAVRCGLFPSSALWRTKQAFDAPGRTTQWQDVLVGC
jgi:hypothetical protein